MEFKLLGPVGVYVGESQVRLGSAKRRGLLAVLLLAGNKPVTTEQLVERLWPGSRPSLQSLYRYVTDLRAAVGPERLPHLGRGRYLLEVDSQQVDHRRFTTNVEAAEQSISSNQRAKALTLLEMALGEWQGSALGMLDGIELDSHRAALTSARRSAWTTLITLRLELGDHAQLLLDVREARALWPHDDELFGMELRALAALNRTSELSDSYRAYTSAKQGRSERSTRWLSELFRELRAKHARSSAASASKPSPQLVPGHTGVLVGRAAELSRMNELLGPRAATAGALVVVVGAPGMGKTSLVLHWTTLVRKHFIDGVLWADLRAYSDHPPAETGEVLHRFLSALGVTADAMPPQTETRINLFRTLVAERRMLVLLDNARDVGQVRDLLPGTPTCATIITTRDTPQSLIVREGGHLIALDAIPAEAGLALLIDKIGATRVNRERGVAIELISLCGGLPLAVSILAANAQARPRVSLAALLTELRDERTRLTTLSAAGSDLDVRAVFTTSYRTLSAPARTLFQLLSLHPGPHVDAKTATALLGGSDLPQGTPLRELVNGNLLAEIGDDMFALHDLLRLFAVERAEAELSGEQRGAATDRLVDHHLRSAYACSLMINPMRELPITPAPGPSDVEEAMVWFDGMADNLASLVDQTHGLGRNRDCWLLTMTMAPHQWRRGALAEAIRVQRLAAEAVAEAGTPVEQALVARTLANTYRKAGRHDQAHGQLVHAIALCRQAEDHIGEADSWQALATNHTAAGDLANAAECYQNAQTLFEQCGESVGLAHCLAGAAWVLNEQGDHEVALQCAERALTLHRALSDHDGEAAVLDSLGLIHHAGGDHNRAVEYHTAALRLYDDGLNTLNQARTLVDLGKAQLAAQYVEEAKDSWRRALELFESVSHNAADDVKRLISGAG